MPQPIRPLLWSRLMVVRCMAKSYKVHSPNKRHAVTAVIYLQVYTWQQFHHISPCCATFSVTNIWRQGVTLKPGIVAFFLPFFCLCIPSDFLINFLVLDFYWLYSYFFVLKHFSRITIMTYMWYLHILSSVLHGCLLYGCGPYTYITVHCTAMNMQVIVAQ